jgi:hypothetical protein
MGRVSNCRDETFRTRSEICIAPSSMRFASECNGCQENCKGFCTGRRSRPHPWRQRWYRHNGASFIAATSTQDDLLTKLSAARVIDYRETDGWAVSEFHSEKFDVVFDLVNGKNWQIGGTSGKAINSSRTYVALMTGVASEVALLGTLDCLHCF